MLPLMAWHLGKIPCTEMMDWMLQGKMGTNRLSHQDRVVTEIFSGSDYWPLVPSAKVQYENYWVNALPGKEGHSKETWGNVRDGTYRWLWIHKMLHQMFWVIRNKQQLRNWAESWYFVKEVMRDWLEKFRMNKKDNRQMVGKGWTIGNILPLILEVLKNWTTGLDEKKYFFLLENIIIWRSSLSKRV